MWNGFQEDSNHKLRCLREGAKNVFFGVWVELLTCLLHDTIGWVATDTIILWL